MDFPRHLAHMERLGEEDDPEQERRIHSQRRRIYSQRRRREEGWIHSWTLELENGIIFFFFPGGSCESPGSILGGGMIARNDRSIARRTYWSSPGELVSL